MSILVLSNEKLLEFKALSIMELVNELEEEVKLEFLSLQVEKVIFKFIAPLLTYLVQNYLPLITQFSEFQNYQVCKFFLNYLKKYEFQMLLLYEVTPKLNFKLQYSVLFTLNFPHSLLTAYL